MQASYLPNHLSNLDSALEGRVRPLDTRQTKEKIYLNQFSSVLVLQPHQESTHIFLLLLILWLCPLFAYCWLYWMCILITGDSFLSLKMSVAIPKGVQPLPRSSFLGSVVRSLYVKATAKHNGRDLEELYIDSFLVTL